MSTLEQLRIAVDEEKLMQFVFRAVDEVGAALNAALVVMGDRRGLDRALAGTDGLTAPNSSFVGSNYHRGSKSHADLCGS